MTVIMVGFPKSKHIPAHKKCHPEGSPVRATRDPRCSPLNAVMAYLPLSAGTNLRPLKGFLVSLGMTMINCLRGGSSLIITKPRTKRVIPSQKILIICHWEPLSLGRGNLYPPLILLNPQHCHPEAAPRDPCCLDQTITIA